MIMRATQKKMMSVPVTIRTGRVVARRSGGLLRPAERGERPQPRREPGVEHVLVLASSPAALRARRGRLHATRSSRRTPRSTRPGCGAPTTAAARCTSRGCSPSSSGRPSSSAPGTNFTSPLRRGLDRRLGERRHLHEPLPRQARLDDGVAARAVPDGVVVRLDLLQVARVLERRDDALARLEAVEPAEVAGLRRSWRRPRPSRRCSGRPCRCPISKSFGSCAGVTFTAPVPNFGIDHVVGDDRDLAPHERQHRELAHQAGVARVLRDSPRRRCRRASSRAASWRRSASPSPSFERVADVPELAVGSRPCRLPRRTARCGSAGTS